MKTILAAITVILLLSGAFAEEKHNHTSSSLVLNNGKKWPVDQDMRVNMDAIYQQFKPLHNISKSKKLTVESAHVLSTVITASAKNIIKKCKMPQKQDEAFHVILADLFSVAADLEKPSNVESAVKRLAQTLKNYSEYFDHSLSI